MLFPLAGISPIGPTSGPLCVPEAADLIAAVNGRDRVGEHGIGCHERDGAVKVGGVEARGPVLDDLR
jgi:hypothetical protein